MSALIIQSPGVIANPTGPNIWDEKTMLIRFEAGMSRNAGGVLPAEGEEIRSILAKGAGSAAQRLFATVAQGWSFPKMALQGTPSKRPAILFDGSSQINNLGDAPVLIGQPLTVFVVARLDSNDGTNGRIFTGRYQQATDQYCALRAGSTVGALRVATGVNAVNGNPAASSNHEQAGAITPGQWFVAGIIFNGDKSKMMLSPGTFIPMPGLTTIAGMTGVMLGGNITTVTASPNTSGVRGAVAAFDAYVGALPDAKVAERHAYLTSRFLAG